VCYVQPANPEVRDRFDQQVISVPVSDPERARAFYALGPAQAVGGEATVTLVTWFEGLGPLRGLVLDIEDLDAARAGMEERGVTFSEDPYGTPWGRFAGFEDPDGNGWLLHQT
jgi:catechol 2,3-dioxygenase-like lactoylglutathione lyase family enzyme